MRHARVSLQLGTLLVICAACARSGDGTGPGTAVIASITVSVNDTSIVVGGVTRLHATAKDASGASISGSSIAFASDSPGVATVSATGIVTGIAAGRARLRASAGSASATLILRVTPSTGLAASVTIAPIAATLSVGANLPLTITVRDAAGAVAGRPVTWTSSDGTRAAVSPAGVVSGQAPGTVTVTATVDGAVGSASVSVVTPPSGTVLSAGPTRVYKTPCAAIAAAHTGDTIEIDAATYVGDVCTITTTGLTLRGIGGRPKLDAGGTSAQGKAIWVIHNPSTVVENIEFANATVPDNNGAGIKQEVGNLIVRNCYFDRNQMGILTGADSTSDIVIERSEFAFSGQTPTPGYEHNIYIGAVRSFTLRWSYSHDVYDGNLVKSRARTNYIFYNRITGEGGTDSYELDLPNAGRSFVIGNIIEQGPNSPNHSIIEYGAEGIPSGRSTELFVVNNTVVNDEPSGTFVYVNPAVTSPVVLRNNIFAGPGTLTTQGLAVVQANTTRADGDPGFVDAAAYDYRLRFGSPAIDEGVAPGAAFGVSLVPVLEYVHPMSTVPRTVVGGVIDRGAQEYAP